MLEDDVKNKAKIAENGDEKEKEGDKKEEGKKSSYFHVHYRAVPKSQSR